jgi:hypothetical protein
MNYLLEVLSSFLFYIPYSPPNSIIIPFLFIILHDLVPIFFFTCLYLQCLNSSSNYDLFIPP